MLRISFVVTSLLLLSSCIPSMQPTPRQEQLDPYSKTVIYSDGEMISVDQPQKKQEYQPQIVQPANGKIAILLPLSGRHGDIGQSMLNAAQMALFDINDPTFEIIPIDTKGTESGTIKAVNEAARQNVKLIIGPLLSSSVRVAGETARRYNLNVVGFTTDTSSLGGNIMTLGILPNDQGTRLALYARQSNLTRVAIATPNDAYARAVTTSFEQAARAYGINIVTTISVANNQNMNIPAQKLTSMREQFDAIVMPMGNPIMAQLAEALHAQQLSPASVKWLGTGLWDDASIKGNALMRGALFAAPSPQLRHNFESQYRSLFTSNPQRLASLAYDATALSVVLLRNNGAGTISRNAILNPNGFAGIDGIFRFAPSGRAERGLAVHQITGNNSTIIVDRAPTSFIR